MTHHWVEALFPPTFKYNDLGELLTNDKQLQEIDRIKHGNVSATSRTTEPIENIYERVRKSYNNELESRKQKCIQVGVPLKKSATQKSTDVEVLLISEPKEDSLWTNNEMKILREAYQLIKNEKLRIEEELKVMKEAFKQKEEKVKKYRLKLEQQHEMIRCLSDENINIKIICKDLTKDLKAMQSVEVFLREDISDLENQKHSQQMVIERLQKDLAQEKRNRKRISLDLEEVREKCQRESELKKEGMRLEYELEIKQLHKEIDRLVKELDKEKSDHVISKKGLDQLRMHFASSMKVVDEAEINALKHMSMY